MRLRLGVLYELAIEPDIAICYILPMKTVRFTVSAAQDLKRHGNMAGRARRVIEVFAADGVTHANNVTQLVGSPAKRMRVGNFRMILEETANEMIVTRFVPRGDAYD